MTIIKKVFDAHAERMDLPQMKPGTLRHFMATNVRRRPGIHVPPEQRSEWLGHRSQETRCWYEHHDPEWLDEAKRATDSIITELDQVLQWLSGGGRYWDRTSDPYDVNVEASPQAVELSNRIGTNAPASFTFDSRQSGAYLGRWLDPPPRRETARPDAVGSCIGRGGKTKVDGTTPRYLHRTQGASSGRSKARNRAGGAP
jgi:hypothetical protein